LIRHSIAWASSTTVGDTLDDDDDDTLGANDAYNGSELRKQSLKTG
jgi:hypothetical protein